MNSMDFLQMFGDIDDKFLNGTLEKEYGTLKIASKPIKFKERMIAMNKLKYIFAPTFVSVVGITGALLYNNANNEKNNLAMKPDEQYGYVEKIEDEIYMNEYAFIEMEADIDGKWIDADLMQEFNFNNKLIIPEHIDEIRQGRIYEKPNVSATDYTEFQEYSIMFYNKEYAGISINFSKNELLPDCIGNIEKILANAQESTINDVKIKIFVTADMQDNTKIRGKAYFQYNDYHVKMEADGITNEEWIDFIKSMVNAFKSPDFPIINEE